jgi:hypothetical protein
MVEPRKTILQTQEASEFMRVVENMSQEKRAHFRMLIELLVQCYTDDTHRAVCVFDSDQAATVALVSVNSNEIESTATLQKLLSHLLDSHMQDAPPKEMMN